MPTDRSELKARIHKAVESAEGDMTTASIYAQIDASFPGGYQAVAKAIRRLVDAGKLVEVGSRRWHEPIVYRKIAP